MTTPVTGTNAPVKTGVDAGLPDNLKNEDAIRALFAATIKGVGDAKK